MFKLNLTQLNCYLFVYNLQVSRVIFPAVDLLLLLLVVFKGFDLDLMIVAPFIWQLDQTCC